MLLVWFLLLVILIPILIITFLFLVRLLLLLGFCHFAVVHGSQKSDIDSLPLFIIIVIEALSNSKRQRHNTPQQRQQHHNCNAMKDLSTRTICNTMHDPRKQHASVQPRRQAKQKTTARRREGRKRERIMADQPPTELG